MATRLRCEGCNGVSREGCDMNFSAAALGQIAKGAVATLPSFGFENHGGKTKVVQYEPGSKKAMDSDQRFRAFFMKDLIVKQREAGCDLTDDEISKAVYLEEQALRTENPEGVGRLEDIMFRFVKESQDEDK